MGALEKALRARRESGGGAFVPYVTGGFPGVDAALLRGLQDAGADALEVGLPFSDPVMDGGVIQEASRRALEAGTTPADVLKLVEDAALTIPVAVMTYVNPVLRIGADTFFDRARAAGVDGVIVPDVPVDEIDELRASAAARDIDTVLLAAPGTAPKRLSRIASTARGFVYCVATYGVTGARDSLSSTAEELVAALRPMTDLPLLVGVGIATPEHAAQAMRFADGVIVGSAMMAGLLEDDRDGTLALAADFRRALD
jgi:tryptophan synthase alpha chain